MRFWRCDKCGKEVDGPFVKTNIYNNGAPIPNGVFITIENIDGNDKCRTCMLKEAIEILTDKASYL
jgi:hypothetical protein